MKITVESIVKAPVDKVWRAYTTPGHQAMEHSI